MKFSELQRLQRREGITVLSSDARIGQLEAQLCTITKERDALRADFETAHARMMTSAAAEREACAKLCEDRMGAHRASVFNDELADRAAAIRARGDA